MDVIVEFIEGSWDYDIICLFDGRCLFVSEYLIVLENLDVKLMRVYKLFLIKYGNVLVMYINEKYCFLFVSVLLIY